MSDLYKTIEKMHRRANEIVYTDEVYLTLMKELERCVIIKDISMCITVSIKEIGMCITVKDFPYSFVVLDRIAPDEPTDIKEGK